MTSPHRILAVEFPGEDRRTLERRIKKYADAANWLRLELHLMAPANDELSTKRSAKLARGLNTNIHPVAHLTASRVLEQARELDAEVLAFEDHVLDPCKQSVLEHSTIPILVLPHVSREKISLTKSVSVPISGENQKSEALKYALQLASDKDLSVQVVHVSKTNQPCECEKIGLDSVSDQFHHEYQWQIDKLISKCSPTSELRERLHVRELQHLSGDAPKEIHKLMSKSAHALLVVEWKGVLIQGHAQILKSILKDAIYPVLVVKSARQYRSRLKVANAFRAA